MERRVETSRISFATVIWHRPYPRLLFLSAVCILYCDIITCLLEFEGTENNLKASGFG